MNTMWNVDYLGRQCSNDLAAVVEGVAKGLGHDEEQCAERGMALHEGGTAALLEAVYVLEGRAMRRHVLDFLDTCPPLLCMRNT